MTNHEILQIIAGFVGSLGFGILFNIRGKRLIFAAVGGLISWGLFVVFNKAFSNEAICYFLVAAIVSLYAEISARFLKTPTTTFITTSLIPLIPGSSLYYTMNSAFIGGFETFVQKAIVTLQLAAALALGVILSAAFAKIFFKKAPIITKTEE
jgi:uncharacterized membrane protein YjjB (DUF3815 family)